MTTYFKNNQRRKVAENTLISWSNNLKYSGQLRLCVSDDGSTICWNPKDFWDGPISYTRQERCGVGASLNAGFKEAFKTSPLVLYLVDDWALVEPLDITPWCESLLEREDIGQIRLGPPHPYLKGKVETISLNWQGWALKLEPHGMVVAQRPALWHKRMIDAVGWFKEGVSALECEEDYNNRWTYKSPTVYLALPHKWYHLESEHLSELQP